MNNQSIPIKNFTDINIEKETAIYELDFPSHNFKARFKISLWDVPGMMRPPNGLTHSQYHTWMHSIDYQRAVRTTNFMINRK